MYKRALALALGLFTLAIPAAATTTNDTVTHNFSSLTLKEVVVYNSTHSFVTFLNNTGADFACPGGENFDFRIARAHTLHGSLHELLLAAKLSGRKVTVGVENISSVCWIKRVYLT